MGLFDSITEAAGGLFGDAGEQVQNAADDATGQATDAVQGVIEDSPVGDIASQAGDLLSGKNGEQ